MKPVLKLTIAILFTTAIAMMSCVKQGDTHSSFSYTPPPPPPPLSDTLTGKEFMFSDLTWVSEYNGLMDLPQVFINTPARHDLFSEYRRPEVYFKPDSSNTWFPAQSNYACCICMEYFWYYISNDRLRVLSNLPGSLLVGKKATIRVKFL